MTSAHELRAGSASVSESHFESRNIDLETRILCEMVTETPTESNRTDHEHQNTGTNPLWTHKR